MQKLQNLLSFAASKISGIMMFFSKEGVNARNTYKEIIKDIAIIKDIFECLTDFKKYHQDISQKKIDDLHAEHIGPKTKKNQSE